MRILRSRLLVPDEYDPEAQKKEDDSLHALTQKANLNPRYTFFLTIL